MFFLRAFGIHVVIYLFSKWARSLILALDFVMISTILLVYAFLATLHHGKEIHGYNIRSGLGFNTFVESALIYIYAKCRCIENACLVFDIISQGDIAT
jgi:hypothetical protein